MIVMVTKLKGRGEFNFGKLNGRISGLGAGKAREGAGILTGEECRRKLKE